MPRVSRPKYYWPASSLSESDMAILYAVRESDLDHTPITKLIVRAVRETYGQQNIIPLKTNNPLTKRKEVA